MQWKKLEKKKESLKNEMHYVLWSMIGIEGREILPRKEEERNERERKKRKKKERGKEEKE